MQSTIKLDPTMTVNEIVATHPQAIAVFNRFGIDSCCGGGVAVEDAARRDGLDPEVVLDALREVVGR